MGREGQPGREVAGGGPAGHVGADFGDEAQRIGGADAIDLREIGAGEPIQRGADIEARVVVAGRDAAARGGQRGGGRGDGGGELRELGLDGLVAHRELALAAVKEFEVLLEGKDEFGAVVPGEGGDDLGFGGVAAVVAVAGQDRRVPLAGDDGAEDAQPGHTRDVTDDAGEQKIHLDEGLLHPLDLRGGQLDQGGAVPQIGPQRDDAGGGAEAAAQQAVDVEVAEPLAVGHVTLAAGDVADVAGVDQQYLEAPGFEDVEDGDPIHPGGFHGHVCNPTRGEPVGEAVEVAGEGGEGPHRLRIAVRRDGDHVSGGAAIDAGRIGKAARERGARVGTRARTDVAFHGRLLYTKGASGNRECG